MEASRREHGMALCCLVPTDKSATRIVLQIVLGHGRSRIYRVEKRNSVLTQVVACVRKPRAAWQSRLHGLGFQLSAEQMPDERRGETYLAKSCKPVVGITSNSKCIGRSGPVVEVPRRSLLTSGHSKKRHPPYLGHEAVRRCRTNFARQPRLIDSAMRPGELDSKMPGREAQGCKSVSALCECGQVRHEHDQAFDQADPTNEIFDSLKVLKCSIDRTYRMLVECQIMII